jgi:signal transduction histidine kinase
VIEKTRDLTTDPAARASLDLLWSQHELGFVFEDSTQAFAIMGDAVNRLSRIHADIRVYLRGQRPTTKLVDIGPGLRSIVSTFARSNADVEIHAEIPPLPLVELDEIRIQQTITNLFQNAVDAMGGKGRISLHVEVDQTCLRLRIADSGPGIPPEMQSRVFEPFFTTKDVGKGLGLGLAICHETIVAHGGTLTLDTSVEQGACFVISLPLWLEHVDSARPDRTFVN